MYWLTATQHKICDFAQNATNFALSILTHKLYKLTSPGGGQPNDYVDDDNDVAGRRSKLLLLNRALTNAVVGGR